MGTGNTHLTGVPTMLFLIFALVVILFAARLVLRALVNTVGFFFRPFGRRDAHVACHCQH